MSQSPPSLSEAKKTVRACVKAARTSFGAGMAILPAPRREGMYALYAFCRIVDDIADDDGATEAQRQADLNLWRVRIKDLFEKDITADAVTVALRPAIAAYGLVQDDFQAIINGMEMDAGAPIVAPSFDLLDLYCDRVASAVGRASVRIFGDGSPTALELAYHLGRAFQLTNILRDIAEDAARGRLYLPRELLEKHGVVWDDLQALIDHPHLPLVGRDLAQHASIHFAAADAAMARCLPMAMRPAKIMRAYYGAIFNGLLIQDWRAPRTRVALGKAKKIAILSRALLRSYFSKKV